MFINQKTSSTAFQMAMNDRMPIRTKHESWNHSEKKTLNKICFKIKK